MCLHSTNTFITSSEDRTLRLWDLRSQSSIKLLRGKFLTQQLSNPISNNQNYVYVGSGPKVYEMDLRQGDIFINKFSRQGEQDHYDNINQIRYSQKYKQILCCDDEGDIRAYSILETEETGVKGTIPCTHRLEQQHLNICNCVEYVELQSKQFKDQKICVSGGFDSTLILWNVRTEQPIKKIPIVQVLHKFGLSTNMQQFPFIHSLQMYGSSVLVGVDSGHVLCLPVQDLRNPKFILQSSLTRITSCRVRRIHNKNTMLVTAADDSFTLFDLEKRVQGQPVFMQKYKTISEPVQVEVMENWILVVGNTPAMSFYQIQG